MLNRCRPDIILGRLEDLNQDELAERGIRGLILDLDNTLCPWQSREVSPGRREWIEQARQRFAICILSNTIKGQRLCDVGKSLNLPTVARWGIGRKPFSGGIKAALKITGTSASQTAIIGDQIFADILGGNKMGLLTVWIPPLEQQEFLSTRCIRGAERLVLARLGCKIPCPVKRDG